MKVLISENIRPGRHPQSQSHTSHWWQSLPALPAPSPVLLPWSQLLSLGDLYHGWLTVDFLEMGDNSFQQDKLPVPNGKLVMQAPKATCFEFSSSSCFYYWWKFSERYVQVWWTCAFETQGTFQQRSFLGFLASGTLVWHMWNPCVHNHSLMSGAYRVPLLWEQQRKAYTYNYQCASLHVSPKICFLGFNGERKRGYVLTGFRISQAFTREEMLLCTSIFHLPGFKALPSWTELSTRALRVKDWFN